MCGYLQKCRLQKNQMQQSSLNLLFSEVMVKWLAPFEQLKFIFLT
jgi:hypothetical protein